MKNNLSSHSLNVEDATELALYRPLWRLLAASRATLKCTEMVQAKQWWCWCHFCHL